ncbi:ABC transporter substrate-binding protein [Bacillus ginsengihumi]|uniref:ABC transporter substrate-binding protein n=1 Tax=Heyndrickxia ginsengihumi TaxID=363870 RepID=A0A0A6VER2_9BACI|nr:ABC transporter substrate-binding protein [Heyndrickxia ginsengihumi]KHD86745.1 ABC transporter substrate-binding protein [Heyndrickxia ginsengihumi]NEY18446.1 ABC transporter substrate-binding protein [Heyndrickxia ginsengihumi]
MKRLLVMMLCSMLLILTGCSGGNQHSQSTGNHKLQKVTIMLDWYPNAVHSFLYVAKEKGYFKEQGLDVDIKMPADTNDPLKMVAANQIDIALSYQPEVLVARGQHIPVQSFAAIVRHPLNTLMVPAKGSVQSPKDLAGKTVGYPSVPLDEAIVDTMVKSDGGNPKKVKMVDVGWDLIPAMARNKTNGLIGGYINHEELLLEKEGHPMKAFSPTEYGVPDYYELVFVASEKALKQKKDMYKKFMAAASKGQQYVKNHPKQSLNILLKHEEKSAPLDKQVETKSLNILLPLMDAKKQPFGYQDANTWKKVGDWLYQQKLLKSKIDTKSAYVNLD